MIHDRKIVGVTFGYREDEPGSRDQRLTDPRPRSCAAAKSRTQFLAQGSAL
jgi:hypothetical protein